MHTTMYRSAREAREHFKDLLDAANEGRPTTVDRDGRRVAAVDVDRLLHFLTSVHNANVTAVQENDGWTLFMPGLPFAVDANTLDEAIEDLIVALRDYARDWADRLRLAPNHADNWGLVQIVALSDDAQLRRWLQAS